MKLPLWIVVRRMWDSYSDKFSEHKQNLYTFVCYIENVYGNWHVLLSTPNFPVLRTSLHKYFENLLNHITMKSHSQNYNNLRGCIWFHRENSVNRSITCIQIDRAFELQISLIIPLTASNSLKFNLKKREQSTSNSVKISSQWNCEK